MDYGKLYQQQYYDNYEDGVSYREPVWRNMFAAEAQQIVKTIAPKNVLDVGCAYGYLVESLRELGVEAYGIDASASAISNVAEEIKPYCAVCSALDPLPENFPKHFDLVVTIEVIEHLYEEDCDAFIQRICSYTDDILFSSTPSDIADVTHFNVQQPEYFAKRFAREGFIRDFTHDASYISQQAMRYTRMADLEVSRVVEGYERFIRQHKAETEQRESALEEEKEQLTAALESERKQRSKEQETLDAKIQSQELVIRESSEQYRQLVQDYDHAKEQIALLRKQRENLQGKLTEDERMLAVEHKAAEDWHAMYQEISNARYWKATKPLRTVTGGMKSVARWGVSCIEDPSRLAEGVRSLRENGIAGKRRQASEGQSQEIGREYEAWYEAHRATKAELDMQASVVFREMPLISILVPAYRTQEKFLREMIDSLRAQSYSNWELCIADASENEVDVLPIVEEYQAKDERIKYKLLPENRSIPENTNEALSMAKGEYIGLLDHDDLLEPNALFEIVQAINEEPDREVIYSDQDKTNDDGTRHMDPYMKPDFNLDLLRASNYISHFLVVKKSIAVEVGGFRKEYNGSQDYDFTLRCAEKAKKVHHIPKVLYHWRVSDTSTAQKPENKMYCYDAAKRAIEDHLERMGEKGSVEIREQLGTYRVRYELKEQPLVSIVISNTDETDRLRSCLESIWNKTTYPNYEILIIENNSKKRETLEYYRTLKGKPGVRLLRWKDECNDSAIHNYGAKYANGEYVLFLNHNVEVISPNWLEWLLGIGQRTEVGVVGGSLFYPDDTIRHAGIIVGSKEIAGHAFAGEPRGTERYFVRALLQQDISAVASACMLVRKSVFDEVHGLDEQLKGAFSGVDFCLRVREAGYLVVYEPNAQLYSYESESLRSSLTPEEIDRLSSETEFMEKRWKKVLEKGDLYYNPNLSLVGRAYTLKTKEEGQRGRRSRIS